MEFFFKIRNFGSFLAGFQVLKNLKYFFFLLGFLYHSYQQKNDVLLSACGRWKYSIRLTGQLEVVILLP